MSVALQPITREFLHFHICCGSGIGAQGFNKGTARVGALRARWRCIGGVDVDPVAIEDFDRFAGVKGVVLDLFTREQYVDFHGHAPPPGWREATPEDFRRAAGAERPNAIFISAPCKGLSGLLSEKLSQSRKYQALNALTVRAVWLACEAWGDDPPEFFIFENVPRIASRGRPLLNTIKAVLANYRYALNEAPHDCGEIGGLAQHRKRFLMVGRNIEKVPPFLYQPAIKRVRGVGEILDKLPMPGDPVAGVMHRMPSLQWRTWVRLAFVEAGKDWRSLNRLRVTDGVLADYGIVPDREWQDGTLGVLKWGQASGVIKGHAEPTTGRFSVADPRVLEGRNCMLGVKQTTEAAGAITGNGRPATGAFSVADHRIDRHHTKRNVYRVVRRDHGEAATVGQAVGDPRCQWNAGAHQNKLAVTGYDQAARTVTGAGGHGITSGMQCVADPRPSYLIGGRDQYLSAGMYGVLGWPETSGAVAAAGQHDNGRWSVADPRVDQLPAADDRLEAVIIAEDNTWHRPFTTLEMAALQTVFDPEEMFERVDGVWRCRQARPLTMAGKSDAVWREHIGNGVPSDAAQAIASVMGTTLLLAQSGQTFILSNDPIWVSPLAWALSMPSAEEMLH